MTTADRGMCKMSRHRSHRAGDLSVARQHDAAPRGMAGSEEPCCIRPAMHMARAHQATSKGHIASHWAPARQQALSSDSGLGLHC